MDLKAILSADRVAVGVSAASKKKILEEISRLLSGGPGAPSMGDILVSLAGREKLGSTALGRGVAIPHGRVGGVESSVGAFVRLRYPVDYDTQDGQPVDLVFGLLVPQNATGEHLKHLADIAERFSSDEFCERVRTAADAAAVHALLAP